MSVRTSFNCLWCGRPHETREETDIEGFAQLCSECVGRAQDNEFLRYRLRQGLQARAAAARDAERDAARDADEELRHYYAARAAEYDDWYLRRGRYSHGAIDDVAWEAELDQATLWLDSLPLGGEIVELAAGTGWWSPLLAQKGQLWLYDAVEEPLERARERLLAHGLAAHIHVRDAWQPADRQVDALFTGFWLSHVQRARLHEFLAIAQSWLKPGGSYAFIDEAPAPDHTPTENGLQVRQLADGREFRIPKVYYPPAELEEALGQAGFTHVDVSTTSRFFLLGRATR